MIWAFIIIYLLAGVMLIKIMAIVTQIGSLAGIDKDEGNKKILDLIQSLDAKWAYLLFWPVVAITLILD